MANNHGGGAFLATLKQKNEEDRKLRKDGNSMAHMPSRSRSSFFGSFFVAGSSKPKKSDLSRTSSTNANEGNDLGEAKSGETAEREIKLDSRAEVEEKSDVSLPPHVLWSEQRPATSQQQQPEKVSPVVTQNPIVHNPNDDQPVSLVIREVSSTGRMEMDSGLRGSIHRTRRASTTVDISTRHASSSMSEHVIEHSTRERAPSVATMEEVYGRTGRDPRRFEMTNPLLDTPKNTGRRLSVTHSAAEIEAENLKRQSLYKSAPHVDQVILLERRNTRAGRSSSIDVRDAASSNQGLQEQEAALTDQDGTA